MGIIKGICISKERGTEKHEVAEAGFVKDWGIQGDAHAGKWHRQVSLLSFEDRKRMSLPLPDLSENGRMYHAT